MILGRNTCDVREKRSACLFPTTTTTTSSFSRKGTVSSGNLYIEDKHPFGIASL